MKLRNKKTGEVWDIGKVLTNDYPCWGTLAQLCEDWEDYTPAEPLIKDEKIRKVVRLWSSVNGDTKVFYCRSTNQICVFDNEGYVVRSIRFKLEFREDMGLEDGYYTVAELCGEEEE
jgi:hypothetical protein